MKRLCTLMLIMVSALVSCGKVPDFVDSMTYSTYSMFAMDTVIDIKLAGAVDEDVFKDCETIVKNIENSISKTIESSDIGRLNASTGEAVELTADAEALIKLAFDVYDKTRGAFDVTVEPLCELWNINGLDKEFVPPSDESIEKALVHVGREKFMFDGSSLSKSDSDAGVDLGGIGKGHAAQILTSYLESLGFSGTVSFGGNIGVVGRKTDGERWNIAVKSPFEAGEIVGTVRIDSGFVAVSGAYERYAEYNGKVYHHIIDPKTGRPSESDLESAVVVSENGALADALSTALFVMGSDEALRFYSEREYAFEAVLIKNNGDIILTEGLSASGDFKPYNG